MKSRYVSGDVDFSKGASRFECENLFENPVDTSGLEVSVIETIDERM